MRERWVDTRRLWRSRLGFAVRAFCAAVCALVVVAPWLILFLIFFAVEARDVERRRLERGFGVEGAS